MNRRCKFFALAFICMFCFSLVGSSVTKNGPSQSETRVIQPHAQRTETSQSTCLATGVTYLYGSQILNTYIASQANDSVYHVSASTSPPASQLGVYYSFQFTGGTWNTISGVAWGAKGSTNTSYTEISLYNWLISGWESTTKKLVSSDGSYGATASKVYYVNSANCSLRMKFDHYEPYSPFSVSIDYIYFNVIYTPSGQQGYSTVVATTNPVVSIGSLSGGYWQTRTVNGSYQVVTQGTTSVTKLATGPPTYTTGSSFQGSYTDTYSINTVYHLSMSSGTSGSSAKATTYWLDNTTTGTRTWSNPSYAQSSNDQRATAATSAAGKLEYTHYLWGRNFGFSITDGSAITGILVQIEASKSATANTYAGDNIVRLLKGGVLVGDNKAANSYTTTDTTYSFGGSAILWGTTWSEAEVEAFGFGVAVSCYVDSSEASGNAQAQIDYITITVYYQTPYSVDYYYSFQFTEASKAGVTQLGWGFYGYCTNGRTRIYLYNWTSSNWVNYTGGLIPTTPGTLGQTSISITHFMDASGNMRMRFFKDNEASNFYVDVDYIHFDVTYYGGVDFYYPLTFTASVPSSVSQLGWLIRGQTSSPTGTVYLWNWGSSSWVSTGISITSTMSDIVQSSSGVAYASTVNGTVRLRIYVGPQASSFTVSLDFVCLNIIYAPSQDTTPPDTPNLFYPTNGQAITNVTLLTWNDTVDNAGGSGLAYYYIQVSLGPTFAYGTYNVTTAKTWYQFPSALSCTTWYWHVKAVDNAGNEGSYSSTRYFYQIADPQVSVIYYNANNPSLNNVMGPENFNTTYHRSIEDAAGVWNRLNPYTPIFNMYSTETVNFTVKDWLGNTLINNQQYTYSPTLILPLIVIQVKVKAYGANCFGATCLHRVGTPTVGAQVLLGDSDIVTWYIYPGTYRLDTYFSFVVRNNIVYPLNLWINATYDITAANYPLYCAGFLVANSSVGNIIDVLNQVPDSLTDITASINGQVIPTAQGTASQVNQIQTTLDDLTKPGSLISTPYAGVAAIILSVASPIIIALVGILARRVIRLLKVDEKFRKETRRENEGRGHNPVNRENVTTSHFAHDRRRR